MCFKVINLTLFDFSIGILYPMRMSSSENRRFPRIHHVSSREILHLDAQKNPKSHWILTENYSASGVRFTTSEKLTASQFVLIYLNDQLMREINPPGSQWVKSGDYYLTCVVWCKDSPYEPNTFEVGVRFIDKQSCQIEELETFTQLMNARMLDTVGADTPIT